MSKLNSWIEASSACVTSNSGSTTGVTEKEDAGVTGAGGATGASFNGGEAAPRVVALRLRERHICVTLPDNGLLPFHGLVRDKCH